MNKRTSNLSRDLEAVRYLDALNAGDLEAVADLWDQASRDPQLEQILTELDGALVGEASGARTNRDCDIWPRSTRRLWVGALCGAAAAAVLAFMAWPTGDDTNPVAPSPSPIASSRRTGDEPAGKAGGSIAISSELVAENVGAGVGIICPTSCQP